MPSHFPASAAFFEMARRRHLFAGARAFVFEVKSSIPTIAHRRRAEVDDLPFHPRKSGSPGCVAENFVAFAGDA